MTTDTKFLKGKTALVTGSTSGIGLAIALGLAKEGANIVLNGFGEKSDIDGIIKKIKDESGVEVIHSLADVSKTEAVEGMIKEAITKFGKLDILVNNAGIQFVSPIVDFPQDKWDAILAIDLSAAFKASKAALPSMIQNKWGRIINIASAHGLVASPFKAAYVAAKHGVVGLTKVIALEMAEKNITCNAICPGYVHTPLVDKQIAEQAKAHNIPEDRVVKEILLKSQPNKQFIQPEDISDLVLFLCSKAGDGMTGSIISIDGGWTAE